MPNTPNYMRYPIAPIMPKQQQLSPVSAFMLSLQQSLVPILQYKMQQQMENDAYTKKAQMEQLYEERRAAQELEARKSDPKYLLEQDKLRYIQGMNQDQRNQMYGIELGMIPKPKEIDPVDAQMLKDIEANSGGGGDKLRNLLYQKRGGKEMAALAMPAFTAEQEVAAQVEAEMNANNARSDAIATATRTGAMPDSVMAGGKAYPMADESNRFRGMMDEFAKQGIDAGVDPSAGAPASLTTRARGQMAEYAANQAPLPQEVTSNREWWKKRDEGETAAKKEAERVTAEARKADEKSAARLERAKAMVKRGKAPDVNTAMEMIKAGDTRGGKPAGEKFVKSPFGMTKAYEHAGNALSFAGPDEIKALDKDGKVLKFEPKNPRDAFQKVQGYLRNVADGLKARKAQPAEIEAALQEIVDALKYSHRYDFNAAAAEFTRR